MRLDAHSSIRSYRKEAPAIADRGFVLLGAITVVAPKRSTKTINPGKDISMKDNANDNAGYACRSSAALAGIACSSSRI
jgi:hypothetical protein